MSTKLDAVCLALVPLFQAAVPTVRVVDGPQVISEDSNEYLFVGYDADITAEAEGAIAEVSWLAMSVGQEMGEVTCAIVVRSGDTDLPAVRARALAILGDCETALRAGRTLGGLVMEARITAHRYFPAATTSGSRARVVFTVTYQAQL